MTMEEHWEIKEKLSKKYLSMTDEEFYNHQKQTREECFERMGKENFIPTDCPHTWKHVAKKTR